MLFDKAKNNRDIPKFAFVNFATKSSATKAIESDGRMMIGPYHLHTEKRKPKGCIKGCIEEPNEYWNGILRAFDWKHSAAMYAYRHTTMEDFLGQFIATYAFVR